MKFMAGLLFLATSFLSTSAPLDMESVDSGPKLGRGLNILGYDRIWQDRAQGKFRAHYFRLIREAGFDHVRLNLMPFRQMQQTNGWKLPPVWFETLDWSLKLAREQKLKVVLDLHEFTAIGKDPAGQREPFLSFWQQVSAHCAKEPDDVVFEVLNEPSEKLTPELWNEYFREALAIIREKNPTRTVIVGPGFWNSIDHLHELKLPANDRNLLVTIHYYAPFPFTHQGASWVNLQDKVGVDWAGTEAERSAIARDFAKAAAWAKANRRPIYLGEFGAYDKAAMDARARYTDAVARAAEANGWSWAYWQFINDFVVFDVKQDAWVEPLLKALIPGK